MLKPVVELDIIDPFADKSIDFHFIGRSINLAFNRYSLLLPTNSLNPENKVENWNLEYITFKGIGTQKLQNKQALKTIRLKFENYAGRIVSLKRY